MNKYAPDYRKKEDKKFDVEFFKELPFSDDAFVYLIIEDDKIFGAGNNTEVGVDRGNEVFIGKIYEQIDKILVIDIKLEEGDSMFFQRYRGDLAKFKLSEIGEPIGTLKELRNGLELNHYAHIQGGPYSQYRNWYHENDEDDD